MENKRVSFEVAKAIKRIGYPQDDYCDAVYYRNGNKIQMCHYGDDNYPYFAKECDAPTYLSVWVWLWSNTDWKIDIVKSVDDEAFWCTGRNSINGKGINPENAIEKAIEYLVTNSLLL